MKRLFKGATFYILLVVLIVSMINLLGSPTQEIQQLSFSEFYTKLQGEQISEITIMDNKVSGKLKKENAEFKTLIPYAINNEKLTEIILAQTENGKLKVTGQEPPQPSWIMSMLPTILMLLVMVGVWYMFMQQSQGGGSKVMGFGKSKAKLHKDEGAPKISFKDVAGLDEEKEELEEIVDFLKNPQRYIELGARIPKGVLLVGPPGTGKTYLSKAVAGEAGTPFYSISGSDFVEMFVGVGASRVRDLFEQAKKTAPSIIFIDEIDAVGRKRGAGLGGGHDEREQTLNQLLVEMDGFGINEGIIIMAATNRPDILDPALLRPGRFDRQVMVGSPDVKGREAILKVHSKNKPLDEDVDLKKIAKSTPGFTPADIENLMNEAALLTVRKRRLKINDQTIEEAITKVIAGVAKTSRVISEKERKLTAYHEAGHAVVSTLLPNSDPVHQVTIVPRGRAGGFTMMLPEEDKFYMTKTELKEHMVHLLGGRVAEKIVLGDISTGASNDLERVAQIARGMVTKYAMSDRLGAMAFVDPSDEVFLGKDFATKRNYSEEVASIIDEEIKILVDEAYETTTRLLEDHIDRLHLVAQALLKLETLDAKKYLAAFNGELDLSKEDEEEPKQVEMSEVNESESKELGTADSTVQESESSDQETDELKVEEEVKTEE